MAVYIFVSVMHGHTNINVTQSEEFKTAVPDHSFSGTEGVFTDFYLQRFALHKQLISPRQQ